MTTLIVQLYGVLTITLLIVDLLWSAADDDVVQNGNEKQLNEMEAKVVGLLDRQAFLAAFEQG